MCVPGGNVANSLHVSVAVKAAEFPRVVRIRSSCTSRPIVRVDYDGEIEARMIENASCGQLIRSEI